MTAAKAPEFVAAFVDEGRPTQPCAMEECTAPCDGAIEWIWKYYWKGKARAVHGPHAYYCAAHGTKRAALTPGSGPTKLRRAMNRRERAA